MKKSLTVFAILFVQICSLFLAACTAVLEESDAVLHEGEERIVIEAKNTVEGASLYDALILFQEKGDLDFDGERGDYGFFITSVGGRTLNGNEFWAIYTSLEMENGVLFSDTTYAITYGDTVCGTALFGVEGLPFVEGAVYIIELSTW